MSAIATLFSNFLFIKSLSCVNSSDAYSRIKQRRDEIGEQIAAHDRERGNERHAHDDRNVRLLDRLPGELSDTGPAVDGLDHDDAAHELTDVDPDHRDDRQKRIRQGMPQNDARAAQTFSAR